MAPMGATSSLESITMNSWVKWCAGEWHWGIQSLCSFAGPESHSRIWWFVPQPRDPSPCLLPFLPPCSRRFTPDSNHPPCHPVRHQTYQQTLCESGKSAHPNRPPLFMAQLLLASLFLRTDFLMVSWRRLVPKCAVGHEDDEAKTRTKWERSQPVAHWPSFQRNRPFPT